ncbi:MAG: cupin domain-containing protein [Chloroflexota bacterium]
MYGKNSAAKVVEAAPGAIRRTLAVGERTLLVEWAMLKGAEVKLHQHDYEQIGYLASGSIDMIIGDETRRLEPGDGYVAPPNVIHGAIAQADSRIVDVFSPVRPDYV